MLYRYRFLPRGFLAEDDFFLVVGFFFLAGLAAAAPRRPELEALRFLAFFFAVAFLGFLFLPGPMMVPLRRVSGASPDFERDDELDPLADLADVFFVAFLRCLLYTSPSPRDATLSRMPSSA